MELVKFKIKTKEASMTRIKVKLILEFIESGMSRRQICSSRHVSSHTVSEVKQIAEQRNITYQDIKNMSEDEVYNLFFPDRHQLENLYEQPDYEYVHSELKRTGVTLKFLWQEYQDKCTACAKRIHSSLNYRTPDEVYSNLEKSLVA